MTAADRPYGKFYDFYSVSLETFGSFASFNMYLVINKCVTAVKVSNFSGHYLRNRSNLDIGVLGYIGIL